MREVSKLDRVCGVFSHTLHFSCALIADPSAYKAEGANAYKVEEVVTMIKEGALTYGDQLVQQGVQQGAMGAWAKAIQALVHNVGVSEEKARELLGLGQKESGSKGFQLKTFGDTKK